MIIEAEVKSSQNIEKILSSNRPLLNVRVKTNNAKNG